MVGTLETYRAKRDFKLTQEPSGKTKVAPAKRLRFVIQKHAATRLHYDLRLELDGVFKSWAVTKGPSLDPADKRLAVEVEDHPLDYGDFEGTIPKGQYGGGTVMLWDRGYWEPEPGTSAEKGLKSGDLKVVFDGERMHGSWALVRMRNDREGGKRTNWLLIKHKDDSAHPGDHDALLEETETSVASGRTMQEIAAGEGAGPSRSSPPRPARPRARQPGRCGTPRPRRRRRRRPRRRPRSRRRPSRHSSSPSCAGWSTGRRARRAGRTRSSSTAIACSCACAPARPR